MYFKLKTCYFKRSWFSKLFTDWFYWFFKNFNIHV